MFASPLLYLPILVLLHTNLESSLTEVMPTPNTHLSDQLHRQVTKLDPRHQVRWCLSPLWRVTSSTPEPGLEPPRAHCAAARHRPAVQALTSTRYPTRPELLFCYPNPTRTTFKKFRVLGFSQQAVSQQAASNLLTIILKFCCFLVALTRNPLFN